MRIATLAVGLSPDAASPITQGTLVDSGQWDAIHVEPGNGVLGGIKGHVYDKETGDPISAVSVSFQLHYDQTDPQGYYEISDISTGTHTFTFVAGGYKVAQRDATIVGDEWTTLDVELTPGEGPERSLLWLWLLLGIGGTAIVAIRTRRILSEPERPRAGYERISWR